MLAKLAASGVLKIKITHNKGYDVIVIRNDITNKINSCHSNYMLDAVVLPKFGNSSISMREVIKASIL